MDKIFEETMLPTGVVTNFPAFYGTHSFIALIPTPHRPIRTTPSRLLLKIFLGIYLPFVKNEASEVFGTLPFA